MDQRIGDGKLAVGYAMSILPDCEARVDSIKTQISDINKCALERGLKLEAKYIDLGFSGNTFSRPGLQKLREDIKKSNWKVVIVPSWNQLATSYWDFVGLKKEFEKRGIKIFTAHMISISDHT